MTQVSSAASNQRGRKAWRNAIKQQQRESFSRRIRNVMKWRLTGSHQSISNIIWATWLF
jgi:hypothetical protein